MKFIFAILLQIRDNLPYTLEAAPLVFDLHHHPLDTNYLFCCPGWMNLQQNFHHRFRGLLLTTDDIVLNRENKEIVQMHCTIIS